jgi:HSP20 family molecular chaperone IbpA
MKMLDYGLYRLTRNWGVGEAYYDVQENENNTVLTLSVPGLTKEDIDIKVANGRKLIIKNRTNSRFTPEFVYSFIIPEHEDLTGDLRDGVLSIVITKKDTYEKKVIL